MVELRVTIDEKLNELLDMVVESGVFQSKAELMRSGAVLLLAQMGLLKGHVESRDRGKHEKSAP
jgi:Arc/MetJ-type ribon-helix-helix transcriptional regulator